VLKSNPGNIFGFQLSDHISVVTMGAVRKLKIISW